MRRRIAEAIGWVAAQGPSDWQMLEASSTRLPRRRPAGVGAHLQLLLDRPARGGAGLQRPLDVEFPGRRQSRTVVQGILAVPPPRRGGPARGGAASYNFLLTARCCAKGELFDSFRYRFDLPASQRRATLPLVFQRSLRPGDYTLVVKLEDISSGRFFRAERPLTVPAVEQRHAAAAALRSGDGAG